jgi:ferrous iron transport protein B
MNCGAKQPVFALLIAAFFFPTFKGLAIHTWERTWQYIKKAGTVILGISIILWVMMTFPGLPDSKIQEFVYQREAAMAAADMTIVRESEEVGEETGLSQEVLDLKNRLKVIDLREAEEDLRNSIAGRLGIALEGISK